MPTLLQAVVGWTLHIVCTEDNILVKLQKKELIIETTPNYWRCSANISKNFIKKERPEKPDKGVLILHNLRLYLLINLLRGY